MVEVSFIWELNLLVGKKLVGIYYQVPLELSVIIVIIMVGDQGHGTPIIHVNYSPVLFFGGIYSTKYSC